MKNFEELKGLVEQSSLSPEDKMEVISFWKRANDEDLFDVVALVREEPGWLGKILMNIRAKKLAKAPRMWRAIIAREQQDLEEMRTARCKRR